MDRHRRRQTGVLDQYRAMQKALSDPRRLVDALDGADDDAQAIAALCRAFQFNEDEACAVLDQQFWSLTRAGLAGIDNGIARYEAESPERTGGTPGSDPG
jgi:hypothetical protein